MKKIDLHLHTHKIAQGESKKRNISPNSLKNKLKNSNIGIAAITNHNFFDKNHFINSQDKNFLLLPGMEIDFLDNEDQRKQFNIIFSNKNINDIDFIYNNYFKNKINEKKQITMNELFNIFKKYKVIILMDYKSGKTRVDLETYKIFKKNLSKAAIIFDCASQFTHRVLLANSYSSLISSDHSDWDFYEKISNNLMSINSKINTFDRLYKLLKLDSKEIQNLINEIQNKKYNVTIEEDNFEIPIYEGLNIIVGDRATGKSNIIKSLKENMENEKIKTAFFDREISDENFKKMKLPKIEIDEKISQNKKEIIKNIDKIIFHSKEKELISPLNIRKIIEQIETYKFKIQNIKYKNLEMSNYELINKIYLNMKMTKLSLKNYVKEYAHYKQKINVFIKKMDTFKNEIILDFIFKNKILIKNKIVRSLMKALSSILMKEKGIFSKTYEIGLFEKWLFRKKILDIKKNINNLCIENTVNVNKFELPNKVFLKLIQFSKITKFNEKITNDQKTGHNVKDWNNNVVPFFSNSNSFKKENMNKFINYWKENKKYFIKVERQILDIKNKKYEPSSGEQTIISLQNVLSQNANVFFLDEPSFALGSNAIMDILNKKISELKNERKKIIIATHNNNLAINSIPTQYIFRKKENGEFKTFKSFILEEKMENTKNFNEKIDIKDVLIKILEGGKKAYKYRKEIYEINNEN